MPIGITVEAKGAKEAYDWLHGIGEGAMPMLKALGYDLLNQIKTAAIRNLSGRYPGPNQEHVVAVRSGALRRFTMDQQITVEQDGLSWGLPEGPNESRIGRILDSGGTIRAKKSKMLRIPLAAALTAQGVDRNAGRSLRGDPNFMFWVSKAGKPILWKIDKTKAGKLRSTPWYILKPSVAIRARRWFSTPAEQVTADNLEVLAEGHLSLLLRSGKV